MDLILLQYTPKVDLVPIFYFIIKTLGYQLFQSNVIL